MCLGKDKLPDLPYSSTSYDPPGYVPHDGKEIQEHMHPSSKKRQPIKELRVGPHFFVHKHPPRVRIFALGQRGPIGNIFLSLNPKFEFEFEFEFRILVLRGPHFFVHKHPPRVRFFALGQRGPIGNIFPGLNPKFKFEFEFEFRILVLRSHAVAAARRYVRCRRGAPLYAYDNIY